tara:strand:- start:40 stop:684 length:645 start_codon:yes stop_codon:yes gene_type:complete
MKYLVYLITRDDGKQYIGTTNTSRLKNRMNEHKIHKRFRNHIFDFIVLEQYDNYLACVNSETEYIKKYDTFYNGLNDTWSGKGYNHNSPNFTTLGYKFTDEQRKRVGRKKGSIPWNKGKKNCFSNETIKKMSDARKGKFHRECKLSEKEYKKLLTLYKERPYLLGVGEIQRNGKPMSYTQKFSLTYAEEFGVSPNAIRQYIVGKTRKNDFKKFH